jgi:hypothetical protein
MSARTTVSIGAFIACLVAGCGGSSIPVAKVADSESTVRAAEEAGAQRIPEAQLHLKLARDNLSKAQALIKDGENDRANLFLGRAQADAEVALAIAHEGAERGATLSAQARLQALGATAAPSEQTLPAQPSPVTPH